MFTVYLLGMGSGGAIAIFAECVIAAAVNGSTDGYTGRFMRGTSGLIEDELFRRRRS